MPTPARRPIAFGLHQLLEYLLAGALADSSVHARHGVILLAGAIAFAVLAATARGPLGVARVCGPRLHAGLDVAVPLALGLAPIAPALRPDLLGIVVAEVAAVAWLRVSTLTRYRHSVRSPTPSATATPSPITSQAPSESEAGPRVRLSPAVDDAVARGARRAGRRAATARRVGRQATTHIGQLRRAWRSAQKDG